MPTCPRCQRDVAPGATTCPAGHLLDGNEWPSLQEFLIGRRLRRIDAVRITRRIAHELARLHGAGQAHGALSTERVAIDAATQNVKLGSGLPPPPPLPLSASPDRSGRIRAQPVANPADDILALGRIFAALAGDPGAAALQTGEPDLDAIAAECARALPTDHPSAGDIEVKLRNWELQAEREGQRLAAAAARIRSELQPWLQLQDRLADIDPEAGDPTLVEIARRQKIATEIAALMDAERARHGAPVAPAVPVAAPAVPVAAPAVPVAAPAAPVEAPFSLAPMAPAPPRSSSRGGLVTGLVIGATGMALVALAFVHFAADPSPTAQIALPANAPAAPPPKPDIAITAAATRDLAVPPPRVAQVIPPVPVAPPDLGHVDEAQSACPPGMRLVPGGVLKGVHLAPYCMDETEVTLAEYEACLAEGKCLHRHVRCDEDGFAGSDPEQCDCTRGANQQSSPVNCVTWSAAAAFCAARGKALPSREQWQWALHGAVPDQPFPWGAKYAPKHACVGRSAPCPVAAWPAGQSPQGIHDLVGNVAEWTRDHTVNGTSFREGDGAGNPAAREHLDAEAWSDSVGFRCVRAKQ